MSFHCSFLSAAAIRSKRKGKKFPCRDQAASLCCCRVLVSSQLIIAAAAAEAVKKGRQRRLSWLLQLENLESSGSKHLIPGDSHRHLVTHLALLPPIPYLASGRPRVC